MIAHDAVAAVVLHKHHLIIRVGAGLIQFVYGSHSRLAECVYVCRQHSLSKLCLQICEMPGTSLCMYQSKVHRAYSNTEKKTHYQFSIKNSTLKEL